MIKHIVMWNLKDRDMLDQNRAHMKEILEALVGTVPGLLSAEVGFGFNGFDAALYCELESKEALAGYQTHPAHLEVKKFVHSVICERVSCDYEV